MMTEARAKVLVEQIPDAVLFVAARNRKEKLTAELGKYATLKKMRFCRGCKKEMTTREWHNHQPCVPKKER